jgi:hypothetical protein
MPRMNRHPGLALKALSAVLVAIVAFGRPAHPMDTPARVPGLMRLLAASRHPILFFGEYHGSRQSPAFFGDAVAEVSAAKPVLVILEQSQSDARRVAQYVDGRIPISTMVGSGEWLWASKSPRRREDGRHSIAMVRLLHRLRELRQDGRAIYIGGTNPDKPNLHSTYDRRMADNILRLADAYPHAVAMVYTGTGHAKKSPGRAASFLPPRRTVSITTVPVRRTLVNSLWICRMKGSRAVCGYRNYRRLPLTFPIKACGAFGIHRSSRRRREKTGFDDYACVGAPISASRPATPSDPAAWRRYN